MASLQQDLDSAHPLLNIQLLGVNEKGLEFSNGAITANRDLPWLQDVDDDGDGRSDAFDSWDVTLRDVVVLDGENSRFGTFNVDSNDLASSDNYNALREMLIDAAMETQKPWMNASEPLDVNNSGHVSPLDVLLIVNKINAEQSGELPPPTGTQLPTSFYDSSGDNLISPLDVLLVVNLLNSQTEGGGAGEAPIMDGPLSKLSDTSSENTPTEQRDRDNVTRWQYQVDNFYSGFAERKRMIGSGLAAT